MRDCHRYLTVFKDSYVLIERYDSPRTESDFHVTLFYITKNNNILGCKYSISYHYLDYEGITPSDFRLEMYKALNKEVIKESLSDQIFCEEQVREIFDKGDLKLKTFMPILKQVATGDIKVVGGELVD